jgi:hypothetical protein
MIHFLLIKQYFFFLGVELKAIKADDDISPENVL